MFKGTRKHLKALHPLHSLGYGVRVFMEYGGDGFSAFEKHEGREQLRSRLPFEEYNITTQNGLDQ